VYVASRCVDATLRPSRPAARELGYGEHLAMQLALSAYVPAAASAHVLAVALHRNLVGAGGDGGGGVGLHLAMQLLLSSYDPVAASAHVLAVALHRNLVGGAGGDGLGEPQKMAHAGLSS
jgi:hypothetical protein